MTRYYLHDSEDPPVSYVYLEGEAEPIGYIWQANPGIKVAYAGRQYGYGTPVAAVSSRARRPFKTMPGWRSPRNVANVVEAAKAIVEYVQRKRAAEASKEKATA